MIDAPPRIDEDDLPDLYPEIQEVEPDGWRGAHAYVRRPDGWIASAPTSIGNKRDYEGRGFQYLLQYGEFIMSPANGTPMAKDHNGVPWNPFGEPWRKILQEGGAKEFGVPQLVSLRWHIKPPYRGVSFPQLDGVVVHDFQCPECERPTVFSSTNRREASRQLRVHLVSGKDESHKYTVADLKILGTELGVDFGSRRVNAARPEQPAVTLEAVRQIDLDTPIDLATATHPAFRCDQCDYAPLLTDPMPSANLARHKKKAHAAS